MQDLMKPLAAISMSVLLAACTTTAGTEPAPPAAQTPQVTVESGILQGVRAGSVEYFKGIPYAAPPVGTLRWEPPQPAAHWSGVREAKDYGNDCMQQPFPGDAAPLRTTPSENCLYLNVWRPEGATGKLPVMVWIHGGGFVNGGSSPAVYDGSAFARDGVILVSINYRLGRFGFFGFPELTAQRPGDAIGNYGYLDQIAALKWVKANIVSFGGDPDNVTIFGESAGGGSVHMLLTSPLAKGLFNKAVVESGGGRGNLMGDRQLSMDLPDMPSSDTIGVNFAKANGIDGTGADALAKLRALPAQKVVDGLMMMSMSSNQGPLTYGGPMVDGKVVVQSPEQAYRSGQFAHVPLIAGANSADIGFSMSRTMDEVLAPFGADKAKALAVYDPDNTGDIPVVGWKVGMDRMMVEPARFAVQQFSSQGLPAYEYRFSYVSPAAVAVLEKNPMAGMMKQDPKFWDFMIHNAQHASEIPYVFDMITAAYGSDTTAEDKKIAEQTHAYWVNFAKTGDPNMPSLPQGNPQWPGYTAQGDMLLDVTQDGPKVMADPWKARLDLTAARKK